ncbi:MAG: ABC-type transport auxiliary lipoprotein family protein, partial [Thermoanaerobaculia bacterium]
YYILAPTRPAPDVAAPASDPAGLTIGVEPFTVDPPYDRDQLVYRLGTDSVEVGFYTYHRWAAPLGDLVAVSMAEGLRGTPGIDRIEPVTAGGDYSAFLRGRVVYLEEIDVPDQQLARLGLELRLVGKDDQMIWSGEVEGSAAGSNETVAGIVEQLYEAFDQALEQARAALAQTARMHAGRLE